MPPSSQDTRAGLLAGVAAYSFWGFMPLYWRELRGVAALEILAHRAFWGMGAFALLAVATRSGGQIRAALADRRTLARLALSGALIGVNWLTFIYAVETGRLVHASLGYFINPLVNVALGTLALGERLGRTQTLAVGLAALGVAQMAWSVGGMPWIALVLATTFSLYGLLRKGARVEAVAGSALETLVLAPVAGAYLLWLASHGQGALGHSDPRTTGLLLLTGLVTALPLVWFTAAARRLPLTTLAMLQFISPTIQLVFAVRMFHEPFARGDLPAFSCIWAGLARFLGDLWRRLRGAAPSLGPAPLPPQPTRTTR